MILLSCSLLFGHAKFTPRQQNRLAMIILRARQSQRKNKQPCLSLPTGIYFSVRKTLFSTTGQQALLACLLFYNKIIPECCSMQHKNQPCIADCSLEIYFLTAPVENATDTQVTLLLLRIDLSLDTHYLPRSQLHISRWYIFLFLPFLFVPCICVYLLCVAQYPFRPMTSY